MQTPQNSSGSVTVATKRKFSKPLPAMSADVIREALIKTGGHRPKAAKLLGLARNTLATRLAEIGAQSLLPAEYDLTVLTPETWNKPRGCWKCRVQFTPKRPHDWNQHFCKTECRKLYHFTPVLQKVHTAG